MKEWDAIYRQIRQQNAARGILPAMPADTTELHKSNVNGRIDKLHSNVHRVNLQIPVVA